MKLKASLMAMFLVLAACASSPKGKIMQQAIAVEATNDLATTAVDYDLISVDQALKVQELTRLAAKDVRRAWAALKAGKPLEVVNRIIASAVDALERADAIIQGGD